MTSYSVKWILQRITAAILVPLTFWFVYNCIVFSKSDYFNLIIFFSSYINSILFLIMMISMLLHAKYGCETIAVDYISSKILKKITIYFVNIIFYLTIFITVIAVLRILNA